MVPKKVLKSHWLVDPHILVGFKGSTFMEAGYVYAPYIMAVDPCTISEGDDFNPTQSISSRYATTVVNNSYYGVINVDGYETS